MRMTLRLCTATEGGHRHCIACGRGAEFSKRSRDRRPAIMEPTRGTDFRRLEKPRCALSIVCRGACLNRAGGCVR
jgi:hypothetical protein